MSRQAGKTKIQVQNEGKWNKRRDKRVIMYEFTGGVWRRRGRKRGEDGSHRPVTEGVGTGRTATTRRRWGRGASCRAEPRACHSRSNAGG